jgi:hypothetical protein
MVTAISVQSIEAREVDGPRLGVDTIGTTSLARFKAMLTGMLPARQTDAHGDWLLMPYSELWVFDAGETRIVKSRTR